MKRRLPPMFHSRLGRRLALGTLAFSILLILLLSAAQLYSNYRNGLEEIEDSFRTIRHGYLASLAENLWVYNSRQISTQLDGLLKLPGITFLNMRDVSGKTWSAGLPATGDSLVRAFTLERLEAGKRQRLGSLEATASLAGLWLDLRHQAMAILVKSAMGTFLLAGFVLWAFHLLVTRHLMRLAAAVRDMNTEGDGIQIKEGLRRLATERQDEIGEVAKSIDGLQLELGRQVQALKASEAGYRNLFETSPLAILVQDFSDSKLRMHYLNERYEDLEAYLTHHPREMVHLLDTVKLIDANPATLALYQASNNDELLERPLSSIVPPQSWSHSLKQFMAFHGGATQYEGTAIHRTLKGDEIEVLVREVVVPGHEHDLGLVIVSLVDLTEIRRVQEEKRLLEQQLGQAQKLEAIGTLAGGIAHDLNNLLSPIIGYGELLEEGLARDREHYEMVDAILQAALRARDLVGQLLAYSRKQTLRIEAVELNSVVDRFQRLLRRTIPEDVIIDTRLWHEALVIRADAGQLEQVVMNLAVNAQDAMPSGGCLSIDTARVELDQDYANHHQDVEPGPHAMLAITDDGSGMDKGTLERVFDPFFTTKTQGKGTGLGLATVYGIVKQHGGHIWVYSEPGEGTTFKIYFPLQTEEPLGPQSEVTPRKQDHGGKTILVVEDNEMVRGMTTKVLTRRGYEVLAAANGEEGLELAESHQGHLDLLLTDVVMPDMNGRELFARISETRRGLKVLYMSGYTHNVIAHRGVLEEDIFFIQKPFTVADLSSKVSEALES